MNRFSLFQCDADAAPRNTTHLQKALNGGDYAPAGCLTFAGDRKAAFARLPVDAASIWIDLQDGSLRHLDAFGSSENAGHLLTLLGYPDILESLDSHEETAVRFQVSDDTNLHGALMRTTASQLTYAEASSRLKDKGHFYFHRSGMVRLFIDILGSLHEHNRDTPERRLCVSDIISGIDVLIESRPISIDRP